MYNVPGVNYAYNKANDGTAPITRVKYHHTKFIEIKKLYNLCFCFRLYLHKSIKKPNKHDKLYCIHVSFCIQF